MEGIVPTTTIAISIDSELIGELFLRVGNPRADIEQYVDYAVRDFLERTADDGNWSEAYYEYRESQANSKDFATEFGDSKDGYHWAPLFLPNGTHIRMEYKKEVFQAIVKHNKIIFKEESYSPSELARFIAAGTSRNAWRDLLIKRPNDADWTLADTLRRRTGR